MNSPALPEPFHDARIGLVLGSGLGGILEGWATLAELPLSEIPGLHASGVPGHAGRFLLCETGGARVLAMQGRIHLYEGHPARSVTAGIRAMAAAGVRSLVLTNAAGGIAEPLAPGTIMRISDHLNLTGASPLEGTPHFLDMSDAYDPRLARILDRAAADLGIPLPSGIYAGLRGPQYETPAEIRMLARLGADAVGMSTVLETIEARARGIRVAALSTITNFAAGRADSPLDHTEVLAIGKQTASRLARLLTRFLPEAAE
jgi:purine-nucleoside phosphorylase